MTSPICESSARSGNDIHRRHGAAEEAQGIPLAEDLGHEGDARGDIVKAAAALVLIVLSVVALRALSSLLKPLCVAVFLFYLTAPVYGRLLSWRVPRLVVYLVPPLGALALLLAVGWILAWQFGLLIDRLPQYWAALDLRLEIGIAHMAHRLPGAGESLSALLPETAAQIAAARSFLNATLWNIADLVSFQVLVFFYLVFIVIESESLPRRIESAYGPVDAARILAVGGRVNMAIKRYFFIKVVVSAILAALSAAAMLAFGLEFAWLWTTLIFMGNFIPYLGSAAAVSLPIAVSFLQLRSPAAAAGLSALLVLWQTLVGYYVEPLFAGRRLHLSPLVVMMSLALWGWLWGIVGLIVSIPLMVGLRFVLENMPQTRRLAALMGDAAPDP